MNDLNYRVKSKKMIKMINGNEIEDLFQILSKKKHEISNINEMKTMDKNFRQSKKFEDFFEIDYLFTSVNNNLLTHNSYYKKKLKKHVINLKKKEKIINFNLKKQKNFFMIEYQEKIIKNKILEEHFQDKLNDKVLINYLHLNDNSFIKLQENDFNKYKNEIFQQKKLYFQENSYNNNKIPKVIERKLKKKDNF